MKFTCPNCEHPIRIAEPELESEDEFSCPSCGSKVSLATTLSDTISLAIDSTELQHYSLQEEVGAGQFGSVWRAHDRALNRSVAIKVPHRDQLTVDEAKLFLREARTAARLSHPNIVQVFDVSREDDKVFIVSQYVDGTTLQQWLKIRKPDFNAIAKLLSKILKAVHYAHEQGIIHRDLKPSNILMDSTNEPLIADFGLAKRDQVEATIATDGKLLGTPAYMSPEQARGEGNKADRRSDVYSMGVMLYEMLVGKRPFKGGSRVLIYQVINDYPQRLRLAVKSIPQDLETICLKALEKNPERRYQTALEMAEDLDRFVVGEPISARPPAIYESILRSMRRRPAAYLAATSILALVLSIILLLNVNWNSNDGSLDSSKTNTDASSIEKPPSSYRQIVLESEPRGAKLVAFRVREDLLPIPDSKIELPNYGTESWLEPGTYFIVAYTNETTFNEVYRQVPKLGAAGGAQPRVLRSTQLEDGRVELPRIKLFAQADLIEAMSRVSGGKVSTNCFDLRKTQSRDVLVQDFWVGIDEDLDPDTQFPRMNVTYNRAFELAEEKGMLLPNEAQVDYLLTASDEAGELILDFPPTENRWPTPLEEWEFRRSDYLDWERSSQPIQGLMSAPLEHILNPPDFELAPFKITYLYGGFAFELMSQAEFNARTDWPARITEKMGLKQGAPCEVGGFRGIRSVKPRLKPEDFDRPIE